MTAFNTKRTEYTILSTEKRDFGVADGRGRKIGAIVEIVRTTFEPSDERFGWTVAPGTYYAVNTNATRDGELYQGGHEARVGAELADAEKYVAKYFTGAAKRAAKQAA
jgi:hypothetical protein